MDRHPTDLAGDEPAERGGARRESAVDLAVEVPLTRRPRRHLVTESPPRARRRTGSMVAVTSTVRPTRSITSSMIGWPCLVTLVGVRSYSTER